MCVYWYLLHINDSMCSDGYCNVHTFFYGDDIVFVFADLDFRNILHDFKYVFMVRQGIIFYFIHKRRTSL